jgi:Fe-S-cluster containining protein
MGESKRRAEFTTVLDMMTGKERQVRNAGDVTTFLRKHRPREAAVVPCDGCSECCYHAGVDVYPEVDAANLPFLTTERRDDGKLYLAKRADGACVHLGPNGCTVREHRPRACRNYDCRVYSLFSMADKFDGDHNAPAWFFDARTIEGRAYLEAARLCGMAELVRRRRAGEDASASAVANAVLTSEFFAKTQEFYREMWSAPPEQRLAFVRSCGLDPDDPEGMQETLMEATRKMLGDSEEQPG